MPSEIIFNCVKHLLRMYLHIISLRRVITEVKRLLITTSLQWSLNITNSNCIFIKNSFTLTKYWNHESTMKHMLMNILNIQNYLFLKCNIVNVWITLRLYASQIRTKEMVQIDIVMDIWRLVFFFQKYENKIDIVTGDSVDRFSW